MAIIGGEPNPATAEVAVAGAAALSCGRIMRQEMKCNHLKAASIISEIVIIAHAPAK